MSEAYTIKPLVWEVDGKENGQDYWFSNTGLCEYCVYYSTSHAGWRFMPSGSRFPMKDCFPSAAAAKFTAEAHWQERIKQALVPVEVKQHDGSGQ